MLVGAALLAAGMLALDREWSRAPDLSKWLYAGGSDGARTHLCVVAGSVVTVAGVVFSITVVALTRASSQFGPRLLRNFMRDTGNQLTIRLLETISTIAEHLKVDQHRAALRRQAQMVFQQSREAIPDEQDRADVRERYDRAAAALRRRPDEGGPAG